MKKRIGLLFFIGLIVLGLSACFGSDHVLTELEQQLEAFTVYEFTAVGSVLFLNTEHPEDASSFHHAVTGSRNRQNGQLRANVHYIDENESSLFETSVLQANRRTYIGFLPLLQHHIDTIYPQAELPTVETAFDAEAYLIYQQAALEHVPLDLLALVDRLKADTEVEISEGTFRFPLENEAVKQEVVEILVAPLSFLETLNALVSSETDISEQTVLEQIRQGDLSGMYLEMVVLFSEDGQSLTVWLTLHAAGFVTITVDVIYEQTGQWQVAVPEQTIEEAEFIETYQAYRAALARAVFMLESDITIIQNLPELRMVGHQLSTELLTDMTIEIGGQPFIVSVMEHASNTQTPIGVYSFSSAMNIFYTVLPAYFASETLALFVLDYLDTEDYDADEFFRTEMRTNAQDTAAVYALYFYDNLVGPTLHIYVLESIAGTEYALMLRIITLLDNLTNEAIATLNELGFYIGLDFQAMLAHAIEDLRR